MNTRISDLLENYREDSLVTEEATPLSMKRIEEMTMAVVVPKKKHHIWRFVPKILVAVMLTSLLAVTAIADEREWLVGDWFRSALNKQAEADAQFAEDWGKGGLWKKTVEEEQLVAINNHGKIVNQSAVSEGSTITLIALYGDEYVLNLYVRVEAPEGTALPDGLDYAFSDTDHITGLGMPVGTVEVPEGYALSEQYHPDVVALPDDDPADNRKDFLLSLRHGQYEQRINGVVQKQWTFNDDVPKTFTIKGLFHETKPYVFEQILSGRFTFDITNLHEVKRKQIDVTGCDYAGHVDWGEGFEPFDYEVKPMRLLLSPFSAVTEVEYTCTEENRCFMLDFQIFMKDGTSERHWESVSLISEEGEGKEAIVFTTPIDLEQVDYILIGDKEFGDQLHVVYP